jgi:hypothetical protein
VLAALLGIVLIDGYQLFPQLLKAWFGRFLSISRLNWQNLIEQGITTLIPVIDPVSDGETPMSV